MNAKLASLGALFAASVAGCATTAQPAMRPATDDTCRAELATIKAELAKDTSSLQKDEAALARAEAKAGVIPADAAKGISAHATTKEVTTTLFSNAAASRM